MSNFLNYIKLLFFGRRFVDAEERHQAKLREAQDGREQFDRAEYERRTRRKRTGFAWALAQVAIPVLLGVACALLINAVVPLNSATVQAIRVVAFSLIGWALLSRLGHESETWKGNTLLERTSLSGFKITYVMGIFLTSLGLSLTSTQSAGTVVFTTRTFELNEYLAVAISLASAAVAAFAFTCSVLRHHRQDRSEYAGLRARAEDSIGRYEDTVLSFWGVIGDGPGSYTSSALHEYYFEKTDAHAGQAHRFREQVKSFPNKLGWNTGRTPALYELVCSVEIEHADARHIVKKLTEQRDIRERREAAREPG